MLSVNLLVLLNEAAQHNTTQHNRTHLFPVANPHLICFIFLFCFHGRWPACLSAYNLYPTLPFHSCSQKPRRSTTDEVMGGMSESLRDCVFALYSTLSGDHIHGYCNGTLILFYYKLTEQKVAVKHVVIQTSAHFERFVGWFILAEVRIVTTEHCSDSSWPKCLTLNFAQDVMMQLTWFLISLAEL